MKKILTLLLCLIITSAVIITVKQKTSASDKLTTTETSGNEEAAIAQDERPIVETIQAETSPVDQIAPDERQEFEQFLHAFREACPEAKAVGELLHNNANNNSGGNYNMLRPGDTPPQPVAQIPTTLPPGLTFDINSPPPASTEVPEILQMIDKLRQQAIIHLTNLANIDTIGYRRAEPLSNGPDLHITLRYNFEPGRMKPTKRSGDLAIEGPGMFRLMPVDQAMPPGLCSRAACPLYQARRFCTPCRWPYRPENAGNSPHLCIAARNPFTRGSHRRDRSAPRRHRADTYEAGYRQAGNCRSFR